MDARLDEVGADDDGRAADAAGGVHPEHGLAGGAEGVGEEQLGLHDPFEGVGCLADDHRVDVLPGQAGVLEGPDGGLAAQAGHGQVGARLGVLGLADADDGGGLVPS